MNNKLTEINARLDALRTKRGIEGFGARTDFDNNAEADIEYLLSLIEEKDKALNDICMRTDEGSWVNHRASYALRTSSNNKGETV